MLVRACGFMDQVVSVIFSENPTIHFFYCPKGVKPFQNDFLGHSLRRFQFHQPPPPFYIDSALRNERILRLPHYR